MAADENTSRSGSKEHGYDPIKRAKEVAQIVCDGARRKYHRFRPARFYGGITTADCVGCPLRCLFCWSWDKVVSPHFRGNLYSPQDVAANLVGIARKRRFRQVRIRGNEPTLGREHLVKVLERIPPDIVFILETNGLLLGHDSTYAQDLAKFENLYVRVPSACRAGSTEGDAMGMIYERGTIWWIKYYKDGKPYRESARSTKESDARRLLKRREGEISEGRMPTLYYEKILYDQLAEDFMTDYRINAKRSLDRAERSLRLHLDPFFKGTRVPSITTTRIKQYIEERQLEGAKNSTINRELAALKRMFTLAKRSTPQRSRWSRTYRCSRKTMCVRVSSSTTSSSPYATSCLGTFGELLPSRTKADGGFPKSRGLSGHRWIESRES